MSTKLRVIEIGATNIRKADVSINEGIQVANFSSSPLKEIFQFSNNSRDLIGFSRPISKDTQAIALAVAGPIKDNKIVEVLPNFDQFPKNFDLKGLFEKEFSMPVIVINDMEAAVTGMAHLLNENKPFWGITWSSGLGGRFWDSKKILSDAEIGHITLDFSDRAPLCGCGKKGHAEAFLGGKNLEKILNDKGKTFEQINQSYLNSENWAKIFWQDKAKIMGIFLSNLVQINLAKMVCFKGKVAENALKLPGIKEKILDSANVSVISDHFKIDDIILTPDGEKDGLIGAAVIASKIN